MTVTGVDLLQWSKFFTKKTAPLKDKSAVGRVIKSIPQNEQLAE